jgi:hypothetical protein
MANSFDSALVQDSVAATALTVLQNRLAPLNAFTADFSSDVKKPLDVVHVGIVSAASTTSVNPATFEPALATTVGKTTVTLDHVVQFFHMSVSDLAYGHRLENLFKINMHALANKIFSLAITPITTTNYGAAVVTTTIITPGSGHLATLWASVSKSNRKSLIVDDDIYSRLIPTNRDLFEPGNGAYGFDNIYPVHDFTGAVSGLDGLAVSDLAIAIASAQPEVPDAVARLFMDRQTIALPDLGMTAYLNVWGSTSSRQVNCTMEVMFGASAALTTGTAGLII